MTKKSPLESILNYWPLLVALVSLVGFTYTINLRLANAEDINDKQDVFLNNQYVYNQDAKVAQAQMAEKMSSVYTILQDIRADMKEDNRRGR